MATESRKIVLDPEETVAALRAFRAANPNRIPPGEIVATRVDDDCVTIDIRDRDDFGPRTVSHRLSYDSMRDVLIRFCLENSIPLPLRGQKSVMHVAGTLVLKIRIENDMLSSANYTSVPVAGRGPMPVQPIQRTAKAQA